MFVDDVAAPGVWHAMVVRSPHAHARIRRVRPRTKQVVTARDLGKPIVLPGDIEGGAVAPHPLLAVDHVHYVGQPVAVVLGKSPQEAADRAMEVEVEYEPLQPLVDAEAALDRPALLLHRKLRTNVAYRDSWKRGVVARVFAAADVTISQRIHQQRIAAISLEGRAVLAVPPQNRDRTLTVWSSTQMPHALRDALEERLPLRGVRVRVIAPDVGGGFGAKGTIYPEEVLVPWLALRLGRPEAAFYLERAIDILGRTLELDPALVRRRTFIPPEAFPYRAPSGSVYDSGNYERALDRALEVSSYAQWRDRQAQARPAGRYLGIGLSSYVETCTYGSDTSRVELDTQGRVTVFSGTSPHGQGGATGFAQIVADALGLEVQEISVVTGGTARIPDGDGATGDRTMVVGGSAWHPASQRLRHMLLGRPGQRLEASPTDLVVAGGRIHVAGVPSRGVALRELVDARRKVLRASGQYTVRGSTFPFGTHVAVVGVDAENGEAHLVHHFAVDDCGVVINPLLVEGQIHRGGPAATGQGVYEGAEYQGLGA